MAERTDIGNGKTARVRNPFVVAVLGIVTFGVYLVFWWYFVNREMADYGRANGTSELGDSPAKSVLAVTRGALVIVPAIVSTINTFKRSQAAMRVSGTSNTINGWIGALLFIVISPAFYAYVQSGLNSAWEAERSRSRPLESSTPA